MTLIFFSVLYDLIIVSTSKQYYLHWFIGLLLCSCKS